MADQALAIGSEVGVVRRPAVDHLGADLSGLNAVVIGRSNIVGKPMAALLLQAHATVTICHSRTRDLAGVVHEADIAGAQEGLVDAWRIDKLRPENLAVLFRFLPIAQGAARAGAPLPRHRRTSRPSSRSRTSSQVS